MSYTTPATSPLASYYTFTPGEIMSGYGGCCGYSGFGSVASEFNAEAVWADVQKGAYCYDPAVAAAHKGSPPASLLAQCNAAGMRATKLIQAGLNELGYGPMLVNGSWGTADPYWKQFMQQHNLSTAVGLVQKNGLVMMEQLLKSGASPGPNKPTEFEKVNGEFIPVQSKFAGKAGMALGLLALAAVGAVGIVAYRKKKRGGARKATLARV